MCFTAASPVIQSIASPNYRHKAGYQNRKRARPDQSPTVAPKRLRSKGLVSALQQAELAEAVQIFPDRESGDAKLAGEVETIDLLSRLAIAVQNLLHEAFLDDVADRLRFDLRIIVRLDRASPHNFLAAVQVDQII